VPITADILPEGVEALKAALAAERSARQEAEARASGAEAMVAHLKLVIAKLKRERFGQSAERSARLLDQLELQLEELEASATEDELAAAGQDRTVVPSFTRKKPVRAPEGRPEREGFWAPESWRLSARRLYGPRWRQGRTAFCRPDHPLARLRMAQAKATPLPTSRLRLPSVMTEVRASSLSDLMGLAGVE
jgi:transposase IS166 family protein